MNNYRTILSTHPESPMNPSGLLGLKLLWQKDGSANIFRKKVGGSLDFSGMDYKTVLDLEDDCCKEVFVTVNQSCNTLPLVTARFQSDVIEWDFDICSAKVQNLEVRDLYFGVYKFWEKKVNMCNIVKTQAFSYNHRKTIPNPDTNSQTTELNQMLDVINTRGVLFTEWVFHAIKSTLTGTIFENIIPDNHQSMSEFLANPVNTCTGRRNSLAFAVVFQASDFLYPEKLQATGINNLGYLSEELAVTLKDVLQNLEETFDLQWYIGTNGKLKIEHISFFLNNLSYEPNENTTLDLTLPRFQDALKSYKYSYKNDLSDYYGIELLDFSLNKAINDSENAVKTFQEEDYGTAVFLADYFFASIDDFDYGNIKFDEPCSPYDESGSLKKKQRSNNLFMTTFEPLRLADPSVDKTKFILLDCKTSNTSYAGEGGVQVPINQIVVSACERIKRQHPNGNFSATAIMRDFLRYNKPFSAGLMSYNQKPLLNDYFVFVEKGLSREMYSLLQPKRLKRVKIPFCCDEPPLNPYLKIKLPDGRFATIEKAEFELATETLNLDLKLSSSCGFSIKFPEVQAGDNYPAYGTIIRTESVLILTGEGVVFDESRGSYLSENIYAQGTRTHYNDGQGGSYFEDVIN